MITCGEISCDQGNEERRLLAKTVLSAHRHKGNCKDCPHVEYTPDAQLCHGKEFDCCRCEACALARKILSA